MRWWFRKPKTDAQLIEETRKVVHISKWLAIFQICASGFFLFWLLPKAIFVFIDLLSLISESEKYRPWAGFAIGIMAGSACMAVAFQGIFTAFHGIQGLAGRRKDLLLLKYHDALVELGEIKASNNSLENSGNTQTFPEPQSNAEFQ